MSHDLVFLDTEFTNLGPHGELLSLALVFDEHNYLYLERQAFNVRECSRFVVETVLPLFDRYPASVCPLEQFGERIRTWAATLPAVHSVAFDYGMDWMYLADALDGNFPPQIHAKGLNLANWSSAPGFEEARALWHEAPRHEYHHALNDALGLRHAYYTASAWLRGGKAHD